MKVVHVITGLNDGGAEGVLYRLVMNDAQDTHHVVSLTDQGKYGPLLRQAGVPVTALGMPRGRVTWRGLLMLWHTLKEQRPDVVQTWMYHADLLGGVLARLQCIPVVWGIRNTTLEKGKSMLSTVLVAKMCAVLSSLVPRSIVACAEASVKAHAGLGYEPGRMVVIPNGYDLSSFAPDKEARQRLRQAWGVEDSMPVIGMVARYDPQKDHRNLIDALAQLAEQGLKFAAVLVGTDVDDANAALVNRLQVAGLSHRVRLLGPTNDVAAVMNALDLHVLSSYSEAFPNVLAEAMACGTPCVTTNAGDAASIVGDTGWVVPPKDAKALSCALREALTTWRNHGVWQPRQQLCRERVARSFAVQTMVERYRHVWLVAAGRTI